MHLRINVHDMAISMLSASAHKFGDPKGVGFLYIRKDSLLERLCTAEVRNGICGVVQRMYPVLQGWESSRIGDETWERRGSLCKKTAK